MNSYPIELLAQLAPVMFVAGLGQAAPLPAAIATQPASHPPLALTLQAQPQDPFASLCARLREALLSWRRTAVWQPDKANTFQAVLVDKDVRFPPRKVAPSEDASFSVAHSPLSPLTPSSPLFPDGLIAPIWIRKHTTLVPSVFVMFLRLFEQSPAASDAEGEKEEKRRDAELSAEIAARKKAVAERGIKLTVVLMASRRMLDDPALDARLTYIRRQGNLDSRASLFVLSPVSAAELTDFIQSLQQALYEPAIDYYIAHSKRVRRKRNRHSQAVSSYSHPPLPPMSGAHAARPLRPEGWTVRYEYKMACFAEFRGEDEVALKHYQDAYSALALMFGSTAILPPRTKRWAEAKVLADCISLKICKLYLYNNEHILALSQNVTHVRKFSDLSRGWGIGEETFEYWSWMAKQHRLFAELLEQGTKGTLVIPVHRPQPPPTQPRPNIGANVVEADSMRALGLNPIQALQHPGFYYYMAARCTEIRRDRFLAALGSESTSYPMSPGYANEKKVDHLAAVLELYTKAYEFFKRFAPTPPPGETQTQSRLTLFIAYRIAQTYYNSGKFDMAVRFFERIAKTYRKEKWGSLLRPLLSTWYACAQRLGDVELSVKLLIEMLGHGASSHEHTGESIHEQEQASLVEDLVLILRNTVPSSKDEPLVVDFSESAPIFAPRVVFWKPEVNVGESSAFQLSITAPSMDFEALPVSSLVVEFADDIPPIIVRHLDCDPASLHPIRRIDLGHTAVPKSSDADVPPREVQAYLRWQRGSTLIFAGTIASEAPRVLKLSRLLLSLQEGSWSIDLPMDLSVQRHGHSSPLRWLSSLDPIRFLPLRPEQHASAVVRYQLHQLSVSLSHEAPAFLDEEYPISIKVTNIDDRELELILDVLLQPTELDDAVNSISLDGERSSGLIKGVSLGILAPGGTILKTLRLLSTGAAGDRTIDISIQSRCTASNPEDLALDLADTVDATDTLRTIVIPTVAPIKVSYDVVYRRSLGEQLGLADLRRYDSEFWDVGDGGEALVVAEMECCGPWSVKIDSLNLVCKDGDQARVIEHSSYEPDEDLFQDYHLPGETFSDACRISLSLETYVDLDRSAAIPGPGEYVITWRRILQDGQHGPSSTTHFPLPPLQPPLDGLIALLTVPSTAKLHVPFSLRLTVRNRHPSRTAVVFVHLDPDSGSEGFVVAGPRSVAVPLLLPCAEETLIWRLVPIECGYLQAPRFRVVDRRQDSDAGAQGGGGTGSGGDRQSGQIVQVVGVRWDMRKGSDTTLEQGNAVIEGASAKESLGNVLVLP